MDCQCCSPECLEFLDHILLNAEHVPEQLNVRVLRHQLLERLTIFR